MSTRESILATGTVETECRECKTVFIYHVAGLDERRRAANFPRMYCAECEPVVEERDRLARIEEDRQREEGHRARAWEKVCPKLYSESDRGRLPAQIVTAADGWQYGPQGLGFIGESGKGKTRSMFLLLRRMILGEGRHVEYVTMTGFSMAIAAKGYEAGPYIERLSKADLLLLDDLGKGKLSDAVQAHLFHIVETRTANLLPIHFTSNAGSAELAKMLSEDRAGPLLRRLGEFCEIINL